MHIVKSKEIIFRATIRELETLEESFNVLEEKHERLRDDKEKLREDMIEAEEDAEEFAAYEDSRCNPGNYSDGVYVYSSGEEDGDGIRADKYWEYTTLNVTDTTGWSGEDEEKEEVLDTAEYTDDIELGKVLQALRSEKENPREEYGEEDEEVTNAAQKLECINLKDNTESCNNAEEEVETLDITDVSKDNTDIWANAEDWEEDSDVARIRQELQENKLQRNKVKSSKSLIRDTIKAHCRNILDFICDPDKDARKKDSIMETTLAVAFEYYIAALCKVSWPQYEVNHSGRAGDRGVDIMLTDKDQKKVVVQVKTGNFFKDGKGNSIILQLIGSCVLHDATVGWVFCDRGQLTRETEKVIQLFQSKGYAIRCFFREEIENELPNDGREAISFIIFLSEFLSKLKHTTR